MHRVPLLCSFMCLLLTGCATTSGLMDSKSDGSAKVYNVSTERAWEIAKTVLRWEGADEVEEYQAESFMAADLPATVFSYGGVAGVWIDAAGKNKSRITVLTKRKLATTVGTPLSEEDFHKRFAQGVLIVRAGKKLPVKPPSDD